MLELMAISTRLAESRPAFELVDLGLEQAVERYFTGHGIIIAGMLKSSPHPEPVEG
jgi:hypothetical protein